jgi:hypothetical protein
LSLAQRRALVAAAVLAILVATLRSGGTELPRGWSFDIASGESALAEAIQNLLLFIPLGMSLVWVGVRPLRAIAIGAALSLSVEFLQQWIPGRDPSAGDVLTNTISTAIGVALVRCAPQWLFVPPRRSAWHAVVTASLATIAWFGTGVLLRPVFPPPPYHDVWTPDFNFWGQYRGKVLSASLGPFPLSKGPIDLPFLLLAAQPLQIRAVAASKPPGRRSPLVAILDERDTKVMTVFVDGHALAVSYHMRAVPLTLEQPDLRWRGAMAAVAPRDTFTVQAWRGEHGVCLYVNSARRCGFGYTAGDGWKLIFYPEQLGGWLMGLLNMLWLASWMLGVGYWGARAGKNPLIYVAAGLSVAGLLLVPLISGLKMTPPLEWFGAVGGLATGWLLGRRVYSMPTRTFRVPRSGFRV